MPAQCVAYNCSTRRRGDAMDDPDISFHSFPINRPVLLAEWLSQMGETTWKPQRGSILCCKHFDKSCFLQNYAQPRLKQNAVPTYFEKRFSLTSIDLDKRAQQKEASVRKEMESDRPRKRKTQPKVQPEDEVIKLKEMLVDERIKRRELELEIYKLRQEKSEMSSKMSRLEASKCRPNIPQNLIPIIVDAMAKGVDPYKKPDNRGIKRTIQTTRTPPTTPVQQPKPVARLGRPPAQSATPKTPARATPTGQNLAQTAKLAAQLPPEFLATEAGKTVAFLIPAAATGSIPTASTATEAGTSEVGNSEPEAMTVE